MSVEPLMPVNSAWNNLIIYNGYPLSVVMALSFHTLIFVLFLYFQINSEAESLELIQPTIIKALFIDENPQARNQRVIEQRRIDQQQRELEQEQQRQAEAERLERERQQQEEARRLEEERQQQATLREREELERQRAEQLRREEEQRDEDLRRQRERTEQERLRQEELENQRARTEAAAAEAARNEFELVQSATGLIQVAVQQQWSRPPSARNGMRAILQIHMLPTGDLVDVAITQSSGDAAFDRSAETAVYRAAPFSELQSLPINVFNSSFRSLSLIFQPEDLLN